MRKIIVLLFLAFLTATTLSCSNTLSSNVNREVSSNVTVEEVTQKVEATTSKQDEDQKEKSETLSPTDKDLPFLGCWSGADRNVTLAIITKRTIQTSTGKGQPLRYSLLSADEITKTYVLELKEIDDSSILDKYIKLKVSREREFIVLELKTYRSYDDLEKGDSVGEGQLFKTACKTVRELMRAKGKIEISSPN